MSLCLADGDDDRRSSERMVYCIDLDGTLRGLFSGTPDVGLFHAERNGLPIHGRERNKLISEHQQPAAGFETKRNVSSKILRFLLSLSPTNPVPEPSSSSRFPLNTSSYKLACLDKCSVRRSPVLQTPPPMPTPQSHSRLTTPLPSNCTSVIAGVAVVVVVVCFPREKEREREKRIVVVLVCLQFQKR